MTTILTLNCYDISLFTFPVRTLRMKRLCHELIRLRPDILCLQEILFPDTVRRFTSELQKAGYTVFPSSVSSLIQPGGLLTATTLPVLSSSYERFNEQGALLGLDIFERMTSKGFHVLRVKRNTTVYTIINTHLHCPFGAYSSTKRFRIIQNQLDQCLKGIPLTDYCILAGDLNTIPANKTIVDITATLVDPLSHTKAITIDPHNSHRKLLSKFAGRIDYILVSKNIHPIKTNVIFDAPVALTSAITHHLSDHYGVVCRIQ